MAVREHVMMVVYSKKKGECTLLVDVHVSSSTGLSTLTRCGLLASIARLFESVVTDPGKVQLTLLQLWMRSWLPALFAVNLLKLRMIVSAPGGAIFHQ